MSDVTCKVSYVFFSSDKVVGVVVGESVIDGSYPI